MGSRRQFIKTAGLGALAAGLAPGAMAQAGISSRSLGGNLSLITGAGCNVLVAEGMDSVVVVDGGLRVNAEALLAEIQRIGGGKPVSALFNTCWRPEHVGLNYLLGGSDTRIIAHENTRLWQGADFRVEWEDEHYRPMPAQARANDTFYRTGSLMLDDGSIEYGHLPRAHTDGDIYIRFPSANLIAVGGVMGAAAYPVMDYVTGGWIGGIRTSTDSLIEMADAGTRIVAGEGSVQGLDDLQAQAGMLTMAYDQVANAYKTGRSLEDFLASDPAAGFGERWGDPELFLTLLYRGTWYHVPGRAIPGII